MVTPCSGGWIGSGRPIIRDTIAAFWLAIGHSATSPCWRAHEVCASKNGESGCFDQQRAREGARQPTGGEGWQGVLPPDRGGGLPRRRGIRLQHRSHIDWGRVSCFWWPRK